ncbi:MAG: phosphonoacetaldehyde hydrolase [Betaproteobacteria bacterium]|nr:phosphonoacetaldehyde hydrolase [Betaproteobacteria bacterium]
MDHTNFTAVVFDWAGTVFDHGSFAPMGAFVRLFANHGVALNVQQARGPMGLPKWDHIHALLQLPAVAVQWQAVRGRAPTATDVDALYAEFTPMNAASVREHAALIDGVLPAVAALRARGLAIGSTTGYNREIMDVVVPLAAAQGWRPDNLVCAGDTRIGRPTPVAMYRCLADLAVWPPRTVVKVDDTAPGIAEGAAAGCWCVGVVASGNGVGLTAADWAALPAGEKEAHRARVGAELQAAGAHALVDTIADLLPVIDALQARLRAGERPSAA